MFQIARTSPLLVLLMVAAAGPEVVAQTYPYDVDTRPKTGFLPDSMVGGVDSIGPANGGLHLNIPIAALPAGAAGMGFELSLVYNSAIYSILPGVWEDPPNPDDSEDYPIFFQTLTTYGPGWRYNFQNYRVEDETRALLQSEIDCAADPVNFHPRAFRTRVGLGDGSMHALHLYGYGAEFGLVDAEGFYPYSLSGSVNRRSDDCINPTGGFPDYLHDVRRTLYSSDGSYIKLEIGPNPAQQMSEWILSMPDGGQIRGTGLLANKLIDANGNWVEIVNACGDLNCTQLYTEIRDPYYAADSNRKIRIDYQPQATGPSDHRITAPTATGTAVWTVDLEAITVDGAGKTYRKTLEERLGDPRTGIQPLGTKQHLVVEEIEYPTTPAASYTFGYSDGAGWGEVNRMTAPGGAVTAYTYENNSYRDNGALLDNPVRTRTVTHDNVTDTWSYAYAGAGNTFVTTHPDGGVVTKTFENSDRERISKIAGPDGLVVDRVWAHNSVESIVGYDPPANNPYVRQERRTEPGAAGAGSKTAITDFSYNGNGLLTSRIEYDWVDSPATAGVTVKRRTDLSYHYVHPLSSPTSDVTTGYWREHNPLRWSDARLPRRLDAVRRRTISNGTRIYAVTEFEYDNKYTTGNLTQEKRWDSVKSAAVPALGALSAANSQVRIRAYDDRGNLTEIYAPDIRTTIAYASLPGVTGPGPYPTRVTYAAGTTLARTWDYVWDKRSGQLLSATDAGNNVATTYTYDALGRPKTVTEAGLRKTAITYYDDTRRVRTVTDLFTLGDGKLQTIAKHDMLGRVVEVRASDGAALNTSATASDGIKVATRYIHASGSPLQVVTSTAYRTRADTTLERTCTQFDRLGRPTAIGVFKGSTPPSSCAATANRTGLTGIAYIGNQTTITDPAGKKRVEFRDALGRLVQVTEDPGAAPKLNYVTTYNYDPLDNLTAVFQYGHYVPGVQSTPVQSRSFVYSSLSRLRSATNPESGTISYTYDDAGNLKTRTDARSVSATYVYDDLHRLKTVSYSDTTPNVAYDYYLSGAPNAGRLKSIATASAMALYSSYDTLGRVTSMSQTIAGRPDTFTFTNAYYLNDTLKSQTYPSGRVVRYDVDDAGRVTTVSDGTTTYADMPANAGHAYAPDGRLQRMKLGNNLWETRDYQTPGTTTRFKLVTSDETTMLPGATERLELGYDYHATGNNGNLTGHTVTRSGTTWTQTFGYDGVNRLKTATETNGYNREFGYDAFGNRWVPPNTNPGMVAGESHEPRFQTEFDAATNRMTTSTVAYDAAGNQTLYSPHTLAYDAENRLKSMTHASSGSGTYLYDGQGRRVKKTWTPGGGTAADTYYVYDIAGNLAAEYGTGTAPPSGTIYPFTDMLGSVRAVTDAAGTVVECYDYLPFGRMLSASDNGRITLGCHPPSPDSSLDSDVSQKFTGQVRDEETRLDYFKARYMSAPQGRFLSPDPLIESASTGDPQSWNRYAYVRNNPFRYTDPSGLYPSPAYECADEETACLNDEQRRILENSNITIDGETLSGEALWNALGRQNEGEAIQNAFVNITDNLASINLNGQTALSQVSSVTGLEPDRIFTITSGELYSSMRANSGPGGTFNNAMVLGHAPYNFQSFKRNTREAGNLQASFLHPASWGQLPTGAEFDIDLARGVLHVFEGFGNFVWRQTTSQDRVRMLNIKNGIPVTPSPVSIWNPR